MALMCFWNGAFLYVIPIISDGIRVRAVPCSNDLQPSYISFYAGFSNFFFLRHLQEQLSVTEVYPTALFEYQHAQHFPVICQCMFL